jgi:hypothetical protein
MDSMEQIMSSTGIWLGAKAKLNPFSRSWVVGRSSLSEERLMKVEGLGKEELGALEEQ